MTIRDTIEHYWQNIYYNSNKYKKIINEYKKHNLDLEDCYYEFIKILPEDIQTKINSQVYEDSEYWTEDFEFLTECICEDLINLELL